MRRCQSKPADLEVAHGTNPCRSGRGSGERESHLKHIQEGGGGDGATDSRGEENRRYFCLGPNTTLVYCFSLPSYRSSAHVDTKQTQISVSLRVQTAHVYIDLTCAAAQYLVAVKWVLFSVYKGRISITNWKNVFLFHKCFHLFTCNSFFFWNCLQIFLQSQRLLSVL